MIGGPWAVIARGMLATLLAGCVLIGQGCRDRVDADADAAAGTPAAADGTTPLTIRTAGGETTLRVTIARTAEEQAEGLMYRTSLADDEGMLFPLTPPRVASFWMENTAISLDLIFIRADGSVESIVENSVPYSRMPVLSGEEVAAVLEVAGGRAGAMGIAPGDRVAWPGGPSLNAGATSR